MKINRLLLVLLVFNVSILQASTPQAKANSPQANYLYYVTQPLATTDEAQTYIDAFDDLQQYKPDALVAMMVNEAGAKIQASLVGNVIGNKYKLICNFNIDNNANVLAQDSFNAFKNNDPSVCSGGFAIDYEPTDKGDNFHIDYFNQLIPMLRTFNAAAPIYLYFNPNQMVAYAQTSPTAVSSFITFAQNNKVTILWPVYSSANVNNLSTLFTDYPAFQTLAHYVLFDILNTASTQQAILSSLKAYNIANDQMAFWQVISNDNCPVDQPAVCTANLETSLSAFN